MLQPGDILLEANNTPLTGLTNHVNAKAYFVFFFVIFGNDIFEDCASCTPLASFNIDFFCFLLCFWKTGSIGSSTNRTKCCCTESVQATWWTISKIIATSRSAAATAKIAAHNDYIRIIRTAVARSNDFCWRKCIASYSNSFMISLFSLLLRIEFIFVLWPISGIWDNNGETARIAWIHATKRGRFSAWPLCASIDSRSGCKWWSN